MNDAAERRERDFYGYRVHEFQEMADKDIIIFSGGRRVGKEAMVRATMDEFNKETTHGEWKPRAGSLYWYPLSAIEEITVYPMLFGQARLVYGRRDDDTWVVGYDYPDVKSAMEAAEAWDGRSDPGHGWVRRLNPTDGQSDPRVEL